MRSTRYLRSKKEEREKGRTQFLVSMGRRGMEGGVGYNGEQKERKKIGVGLRKVVVEK